MNYEKIKERWDKEKPNVLLALLFGMVFLAGFGTGNYNKSATLSRQKNLNHSNYTIFQKKSEEPLKQEVTQKDQVLGNGKPESCLVRGNISDKGDKVYHTKGGAFYDRVKAEQCFTSEDSAKAAGFRKSAR